MYIDAEVRGAVEGEDEVVIPVDCDYVEADEDDIREWVYHELEDMFPDKNVNYNFEIVNLDEVINALSEFVSTDEESYDDEDDDDNDWKFSDDDDDEENDWD